MKTCPNCKQTVSDTAKFCGKCGFNIKKYEENDIEECFCDECGKKISAGSDFCPECGANLSDITSNTFTSFTSLGGFDFSTLQNEAQTQLNENELSAFEFEKMSNGKYVIKKLKNKDELIIFVPDCVQIIGENAFEDSSVIDVTLPEGLIKIGARAFANCTYLETIAFPDSLRIIDDEAFVGCARLDIEAREGIILGKDVFKNTLTWIKNENERKLKEEEDAKAKAEEEKKAKAKAKAEAKAKERKRKEEAEKKQKQEEYERQLSEKKVYNHKLAVAIKELERDVDVTLRPLYEKRTEILVSGNRALAVDYYYNNIHPKLADIIEVHRQRLESANLMEFFDKSVDLISSQIKVIQVECLEAFTKKHNIQ